jgi:hypothetical protein
MIFKCLLKTEQTADSWWSLNVKHIVAVKSPFPKLSYSRLRWLCRIFNTIIWRVLCTKYGSVISWSLHDQTTAQILWVISIRSLFTFYFCPDVFFPHKVWAVVWSLHEPIFEAWSRHPRAGDLTNVQEKLGATMATLRTWRNKSKGCNKVTWIKWKWNSENNIEIRWTASQRSFVFRSFKK